MPRSKTADVLITAAEIRLPDGRVAATIEAVGIGGGVQTVTVDGIPEDRVHEVRRAFHVRFVSPNRMLPDELREVDDWDEAVKLAGSYAAKLDAHAEKLASLADDLKV